MKNENNEKSLQNLTPQEEPFDVIRPLLQPGHYITQDEIRSLSFRERELLVYVISQRLDELARFDPQEYEREAERYENILIEKSRNRNWDANHVRIKKAIENYLKENGCLPTLTELASLTNLSRQTVAKHLAEFEMEDYLKEEMQMYNIMFSDLMAVLYKSAMEENIAAIKLFAEILEKRNSGNNTINIKNQQINVMLKTIIWKNIK